MGRNTINDCPVLAIFPDCGRTAHPLLRMGNIRLDPDILHLEIERLKVPDQQRSLSPRCQWTCCNCSGF
jgi:hypothetical protein